MEHAVAGVRRRDLVVTVHDGELVAVVERVFVKAEGVEHQTSSPDIYRLNFDFDQQLSFRSQLWAFALQIFVQDCCLLAVMFQLLKKRHWRKVYCTCTVWSD